MKLNGKLIIAGLTSALICGLVGSITGTFAWYGYSTRATATIAGTAINAGANLEIGIADDTVASIKGLAENADENGIFWQEKGGGLRHDAIIDYLAKKQYGGVSMSPVTSGNYNKANSTDRADLAPIEFLTYQGNAQEAAQKEDYFVLPLAFRVYDNKTQDYSLDGIGIYLQDIEVDLEDAVNKDLAKAFRIDFKEEQEKNSESPKYTILAPGREENGKTELAGLLDLNQDGFADVEENDYGYKVRHELVYGTLTGTYNESVTYAAEATTDYAEIPANYDFPVHLDKADHYSEANVLKVTDYQAFEQEFLGTKSLLCDFSASNRIVNTNSVEPIATTSTTTGIVYLTLTAWLEGWDLEGFTDIENTDGYPFHLNLQFQIDRVD